MAASSAQRRPHCRQLQGIAELAMRSASGLLLSGLALSRHQKRPVADALCHVLCPLQRLQDLQRLPKQVELRCGLAGAARNRCTTRTDFADLLLPCFGNLSYRSIKLLPTDVHFSVQANPLV